MILSFDKFAFDTEMLELRREGELVPSDALLLRILAALGMRAGQLVSKEELVLAVWGKRVVTDNALTVAIARLRKLLGQERDKREFIVTVYGRGYRFTASVVAGTSPPRARPGLVASPAPLFVGRDPVMKHLRAALAAARDGRGSACMLLGEPGIGKTRAVETLANEAAQAGIPVAWGYCREVGDTPPLWPFAQLVREVLAKVPLDAAEGQLGRLMPHLQRLLPELADPAPPQLGSWNTRPSPTLKHELFDATARLFAIAARRSPCVLILDDLHRADPASLELLRYLMDELAVTGIALYGMVRSSDEPHPHLSHVLGHRNVTRIALPPLSEQDVADYVSSVLHEPHPALAQAVFLKSEGNPFFMTELLRHVREGDRVEPAALHVSDAALELVRQRAAKLDDAARGLLSHAAVIGRRFDLPLLHTISGGSIDSLMTALDDALARGVVTTEANGATAFAFAHELLRSALYDALPRRERRGLHLTVARALEQRAELGENVPAADLAYHYRAALPQSDPRKVVQHCREAAKQAAYLQSYTDAARYMGYARQALDLLEHPSPRLRMALLLHQATFLHTHSIREAEPLIRSAIEIARAQRAGDALANAAILLDPFPGATASSDSCSLLEEALQLLPEDAHGPRARVLSRLATMPPLAYDVARGSAVLARAKRLAQTSGEPLAIYLARVAELYRNYEPTSPLELDRTLDEVERLSRDAMAMANQPVLRESYRAIAALQAGDLEAMNAAIARGAAHCRQLDTERGWFFDRFAAIALVNAGRLEEGAALLEPLHHRTRGDSFYYTNVLCAYDECVVLGRPASLPLYELRNLFAQNPGDPPNVWALKVRTLTAAGLHDDARALLGQIKAAQLASLPHDHDYLGTLGALARASTTLRMSEYSAALQPLLSPYANLFAANTTFFNEGRIADIIESLRAAR
jgi:eukaryotic-like serine/threonine-protein kinase